MDLCRGVLIIPYPGGITSNNNIQLSDIEFKVSPNPANDFLEINFSDQESGYISMFDMSGKEIFQSKIERNNLTISTRDLTDGFYTIVYTDGSNIHTRKVQIIR